MNKKIWSIVLLVALVAVVAISAVLAGCGGATTTTTAAVQTTGAPSDQTTAGSDTTAATTASGGGYTFARVSPIASNQVIVQFDTQLKKTAEQLGDKVTISDANLSADKQVADLDTFISMKVNGISTASLGPASVLAYQRVLKAGIPLITEISPGPSQTTGFVVDCYQTPDKQADAAKYIADRIPGAKILVIGGEPVPYITYITKNMLKAAPAAGLTVLEHQDNLKDVASNAQTIVQDLLTKYPDVQAIWCFNEPSALGAAAAVKSAGKTIWNEAGDKKGIIITATNGSPEGIEGVKAGMITMTYDGLWTEMGAGVAEELDRLASGQMKLADAPKIVMLKSVRYDGTNIGTWIDPAQRTFEKGFLDTLMQGGTDEALISDFLSQQQ